MRSTFWWIWRCTPAHNRLLVFARKPAPVQATYLGYCGSTGMEAMDYRLSDPYLDPPDADLSFYSERTIRLPETYWCYSPAGPTPEPSPPPAAAVGYVAFGCLNNFAKVSPPALDLWAEILQRVPRSRLIVHAPPGRHLDAVRERFAGKGISPDRLEFVDKQPWPQYMQTYSRIDIALDPFPWGGGITTCEALWMGMPVVSLVGRTAVGRGGASILANIGMPELLARTPDQYVADRHRPRREPAAAGRAAPHLACADAGVAADGRSALRPQCRGGLPPDVAELVPEGCGLRITMPGQMTLEQQLQSGLSRHQAGRLAEAEKIYRQVLAQQPDHADALHLLGVLAVQTGRLDTAVDLIRRAIEVCPTKASYHSDLCLALRQGTN